MINDRYKCQNLFQLTIMAKHEMFSKLRPRFLEFVMVDKNSWRWKFIDDFPKYAFIFKIVNMSLKYIYGLTILEKPGKFHLPCINRSWLLLLYVTHRILQWIMLNKQKYTICCEKLRILKNVFISHFLKIPIKI